MVEKLADWLTTASRQQGSDRSFKINRLEPGGL
jgi:hypothetical protein